MEKAAEAGKLKLEGYNINTRIFVITHNKGKGTLNELGSLLAVREEEKAREKVDYELKYVRAIAKKLLKFADKSNAGWLARVKENQTRDLASDSGRGQQEDRKSERKKCREEETKYSQKCGEEQEFV